MTDATTWGRKGFQSTSINSIQGSRIPREGGHVRKDKTPLNAVTDETVALIIPAPEPGQSQRQHGVEKVVTESGCPHLNFNCSFLFLIFLFCSKTQKKNSSSKVLRHEKRARA